jgi:hypothetical protein
MIKFKTIIARFAHAKKLINSPVFSLLAEEGREFFRRKHINYGIRTGDFCKAHETLANLLMYVLKGDPRMFKEDDPRHKTAADLAALFTRAKIVGLSDLEFITAICLQGILPTETLISEAVLKACDETTKIKTGPLHK